VRVGHGSSSVAGPLAEPTLPTSLLALLSPRPDALSPADRRLCRRRLGVPGGPFTAEAAAAVTARRAEEVAEGLRGLLRVGILVPAGPPIAPPHAEDGFSHPLIARVAHELLTRKERKRPPRRRRAARAVERRLLGLGGPRRPPARRAGAPQRGMRTPPSCAPRHRWRSVAPGRGHSRSVTAPRLPGCSNRPPSWPQTARPSPTCRGRAAWATWFAGNALRSRFIFEEAVGRVRGDR
jgi:hypothetical protein